MDQEGEEGVSTSQNPHFTGTPAAMVATTSVEEDQTRREESTNADHLVHVETLKTPCGQTVPRLEDDANVPDPADPQLRPNTAPTREETVARTPTPRTQPPVAVQLLQIHKPYLIVGITHPETFRLLASLPSDVLLQRVVDTFNEAPLASVNIYSDSINFKEALAAHRSKSILRSAAKANQG